MRWSGHNRHRAFRGPPLVALAALAGRVRVRAARAPAARASPTRSRTTIDRAPSRAGAIDAEQRSAYLVLLRRAPHAQGASPGQRRAELGYVLDTMRAFARQKRLTARLRPMFLILDRNRDWWAKAGPPGSGARLHVRRQPRDLPVLPRARACSSIRSRTSAG